MENSVGTFRTDRLMQGDRPSQVTVNTGSTVVVLVILWYPGIVALKTGWVWYPGIVALKNRNSGLEDRLGVVPRNSGLEE